MKKAEVGNVIEFKDGLQGVVEKVNENSVIVDLTYMENFKDLDLDQRTVVNHKNYKIIKSSIFMVRGGDNFSNTVIDRGPRHIQGIHFCLRTIIDPW